MRSALCVWHLRHKVRSASPDCKEMRRGEEFAGLGFILVWFICCVAAVTVIFFFAFSVCQQKWQKVGKVKRQNEAYQLSGVGWFLRVRYITIGVVYKCFTFFFFFLKWYNWRFLDRSEMTWTL